MADPGREPVADATLPQRLLLRLVVQRAVLLTIGVALLVLVLAGRLGLAEALLTLVAVALVATLARAGGDFSSAGGHDAMTEAARAHTMRAFADALPEPTILLDRRAIVLHVNPSAAHEFPTTRPGDPIGLSIRHPELLGAVEAARATRLAQTTALHRTVPAETWHRVVVAPLSVADEPGAGGVLVVSMHNQTEEKRIDAMRSDFIANASHELRTPLTSLVGFIDTLLGPAAKDAVARERFLNIMRAQAARMSKLIDDLLSLSRIEMRQHMRPTDRVDLGILLGEVREGFAVQAKEAGVSIELRLPDAQVSVTGDREELYEVFENLLENAVKYGGDGGRVEVRLAPVNRQGFDYAVEVVDFGAGIAPEHVPRLTERFYRVDEESSRKKKGTGLGLAIVKHIVNRHRGAMSIRSRPNEGTQVEVLLPK